MAKLTKKQKDCFADRFLLFNKDGTAYRVNDKAIMDYIIETYPLFILGDEPYIYQNGAYVYGKVILKELIYQIIEPWPRFISSSVIKRIYDLFFCKSSLVIGPEEVNDYPSYWINFKNGFYDLREHKLVPHDPKYKAINQIPWDYDVNAEFTESKYIEPFLKFAITNSDDREMALEYFGLCLTKDMHFQKMLVIHGVGGSGKSTLISLLEKVEGKQNLSHISLLQLTQRFGAAGLLGKLLNTCADIESTALEDNSIIKKIVGKDTISVEKKGKDSFDIYASAKMVFSANELPSILNDKTTGFYRKVMVLEMNNNVPYEQQDIHLDEKLESEINYFIHLIVDAAERLYEHGSFIESVNSKNAVLQWQNDNDVVQAFINDECDIAPDKKIKGKVLFDEFEKYCDENGRTKLNQIKFFKAIREKGFQYSRIKGYNYFKGLNLVDSEFVKMSKDETTPFDELDKKAAHSKNEHADNNKVYDFNQSFVHQ